MYDLKTDRLPVRRFIWFIAFSLLFQPALFSQYKAERQAIDRVINELGKRQDAPGGVIAVRKAGKLLYKRAFGMADLEYQVPNTPQTLFEAGSVSKQFTAAAVLLLAIDGKLALSDDIRKYIPELREYGAPVRIENLLTHTSGIKDWGTVAQMGGWPRTTKVYTQEEVYDIIFRQKTLNFLPGTGYAYSNSNYNLLALLVERISGKAFTAFTRERLFEKAGMKSTRWRTDFRKIVPNRAIAYRKDGNRYEQFMPFENTYGHAALLTTTEDLLNWNNYLAAKSFGDDFDSLRLKQFIFPGGKKGEYAGGALFIREVNGLPEICHTGSTAGYRSWLAYYPTLQLSVAYLSNDASIASIYMARKISDIFLGGKGTVNAPAVNPNRVSGIPTADKAGIYKCETAPFIIELGMQGDSLYLVKEPEWNPMYNDPWKLGLRTFSIAPDGTLNVTTPVGNQIFRKTGLSSEPLQPETGRFTGKFYSEECKADVWITEKEGELYLTYQPGPRFKLKRLYANDSVTTFITENNILLEFTVNDRKQAVSFSASLSQEQYNYSRADNLVFNKIDIRQEPDPDSLWMSTHYIKKEVLIPMRDGVKLFTAVYQPRDTTGKHPVLLTRTPYSSAPYGQAFKDFWKGHFNRYVKEQYILVIQDVRGRWMSEGQFENIRPFNPHKNKPADVDEATDAYDIMDWLVNNLRNNNGNIGVYGGSYGGFYTLMAGLSGHPALKAISPQAPVTDWFMGDDFHHNGAFFAMDAFAFLNGYDKPRPLPSTTMDNRVPYFTKDNYRFYLETGAIKNLTKLTGDSIVFWKSLMSHPNHDDWWKKRTVTNFLRNLKPATLVVGSPFDAENAYGAWNTYKQIKALSPETPARLIMGPWYHMQWVRGDGVSIGNIQFGSNTSQWYAENVEYPFFDYYLKGTGKGPATKEVTVFFSGENQWHEFAQWPPQNKNIVPYFPGPGGKLSRNKPVTNGWTEYVSDPANPVPYTENVHFARTLTYMTDDQRFASRRPDVLVFQTEALEEDITLAGQPEINLSVSISGTDADFIVKLIDVFPDDFSYGPDAPTPTPRIPSATYPMGGYQMLVKGEVMRGKYRNSFEHPEPFIPGEPTVVKFNLPDVAHTFKKGHRIMIQVQSSWFPLVDRNPQQFLNIYECNDEDFKKATIRVFHQKENVSYIGLPVLN